MSDYIKGLVSVIIPTYRRSDMLDRAIKSVLNQSYKNIELLLVNDNVPGDEYSQALIERVKAYADDNRFRLVLQEKHINGAVARNVGIKQAQGEYIAFLDDDDWWEPDKLGIQVEALSKLPAEWGGVSCRYRYVDADGKTVSHSAGYKSGKIYKDILMLAIEVPTSSLMLRHDCLDKTGAFDENLRRHQDFQLMVDFTYEYKMYELEEELLLMDVSDSQNRPDGNMLKEHKQRFFESVRPIMDTLTKREQKCVYAIHNFELGYIFFKNHDIKKGLKYCLKVLTSFGATVISIKKIFHKIVKR